MTEAAKSQVQEHKVVVGVDGSDGSLKALRFAIEEARRRGASVEVIHSWRVVYMGEPMGMVPLQFPAEQFADTAKKVLGDALDSVKDDAKGVTLVGKVVQGPAAQTLIDAGKSAECIVVGRRGHGGFFGLVLGSVAQQVAYHASCPVVLIPND